MIENEIKVQTDTFDGGIYDTTVGSVVLTIKPKKKDISQKEWEDFSVYLIRVYGNHCKNIRG